MPYTISKTTNPLKINEQEYASGPEIKFTAFTSCIGVIAKKGTELTAIHLVIVAKDGSTFCANDVPEVVNLLPKTPDAVTIFGCIDVWNNPANGKELNAAFQKLTGELKTAKKHQQPEKELCTYGAKIDGNDIKIIF